MKILAIGDLVGSVGVKKLKTELTKIREEEKIDFVIVNGENAGEGMGITEKNFKDILEENVDVITMGNHTWGKKDIFKFIEHPKLLRPANYPKGVVGKGLGIYECNGKKIAVINLMGRVDINILTEKDYVTHPKESGYSSYHIIVEVPVTLSKNIVYVKVEIQIRTIAMDFWANLEHKMKYKPEESIDKKTSKEWISCAKIIQKLDNKMMLLSN